MGKNLDRRLYQPRLVLADTDTLATLPRELLAGYAETVEYGLIRDAGFFDRLKPKGSRSLDLGPGGAAPCGDDELCYESGNRRRRRA